MFKSAGSDSRFFTNRRGEVEELRSDLNSTNRDKVKDAVKKVIASMTVGKDVSALFTDVIKSMPTSDIELKKLVYLYIINYARSQPDKAILVVNSFQKDAKDRNPLIRALAIRTMGCIRVDKIIHFLCDPLAACLRDSDPYVRKTAAVCVAKLYNINAELVEEQGFLDALREMISDNNHTVVANAVAALVEISEASGKDMFKMSSAILSKLLTALDACTEWGQVSILDCLAKYAPSSRDAEDIIERVAPRLKHANAAVSMSAIKVIIKYLDIISTSNPDLVETLVTSKLAPPLITLLSERRAEIQYVALRNILLIVQKRPEILSQHIRHFYCKYNDPLYVKMEKLEILISLASDKNIDGLLLELREYANEVDVDFVRRAVRAIGRCAIKLANSHEKCVNLLINLIRSSSGIDARVNYVVQEAVVIIRDIFRKYDIDYKSILPVLCENLESLDDPEARSAIIWIIGEYGQEIDNACEILQGFADTFESEPFAVQLQLLTSIVKVFLKTPSRVKDLVAQVLDLATKHSDSPDVRDRGYLYWRLLSSDPAAAVKVVLAAKQPISIEDEYFSQEPDALQKLLGNLSSLASVFHRLPESFVSSATTSVVLKNADDVEEDADVDVDEYLADDDDLDNEGSTDVPADIPTTTHTIHAPAATPASNVGVIDLLGLGLGDLSINSPSQPQTQAQTQTSTGSSGFDIDLFGLGATPSKPAAPVAAPTTGTVILTADKGFGLVITSRSERINGTPTLIWTIQNTTSEVKNSFSTKFNANFLNVAVASQIRDLSLNPGATATVNIPLAYQAADFSLDSSAKHRSEIVQIALRVQVTPPLVAYFTETIPCHIFFEESGMLDKGPWVSTWQKLGAECQAVVPPFPSNGVTAQNLVEKLAKYNVIHMATRNVPASGAHSFYSARFHKNYNVLYEVNITNEGTIFIKCKVEDGSLSQMLANALQRIIA